MKSELNRYIGNSGKIFFLLGMFLGTGIYFAGCGGRGDTANNGDPNAGTGSQYVAPEGGGSTLRLELEGSGNELRVSQRRGFKVTAIDPTGTPFSNIRIFCESEKGIAILEPSSGGVAFAHTNSNGVMSGVLGGLLPGSYMIECRAPRGFDLYTRTHLRVTGNIPEGFVGFPGAAGDNLGGGAFVEVPEVPAVQNAGEMDVLFMTASGSGVQSASRSATIDTIRGMCPIDNPSKPEIFTPDGYAIHVVNSLAETVFLRSVSMEVPNSSGAVVSEQQLGGIVIDPGSSTEFTGSFTEILGDSKVYAGTNVPVLNGTHTIRFLVTLESASGQIHTIEHLVTVRALNVNAC